MMPKLVGLEALDQIDSRAPTPVLSGKKGLKLVGLDALDGGLQPFDTSLESIQRQATAPRVTIHTQPRPLDLGPQPPSQLDAALSTAPGGGLAKAGIRAGVNAVEGYANPFFAIARQVHQAATRLPLIGGFERRVVDNMDQDLFVNGRLDLEKKLHMNSLLGEANRAERIIGGTARAAGTFVAIIEMGGALRASGLPVISGHYMSNVLPMIGLALSEQKNAADRAGESITPSEAAHTVVMNGLVLPAGIMGGTALVNRMLGKALKGPLAIPIRQAVTNGILGASMGLGEATASGQTPRETAEAAVEGGLSWALMSGYHSIFPGELRARTKTTQNEQADIALEATQASLGDRGTSTVPLSTGDPLAPRPVSDFERRTRMAQARAFYEGQQVAIIRRTSPLSYDDQGNITVGGRRLGTKPKKGADTGGEQTVGIQKMQGYKATPEQLAELFGLSPQDAVEVTRRPVTREEKVSMHQQKTKELLVEEAQKKGWGVYNETLYRLGELPPDEVKQWESFRASLTPAEQAELAKSVPTESEALAAADADVDAMHQELSQRQQPQEPQAALAALQTSARGGGLNRLTGEGQAGGIPQPPEPTPGPAPVPPGTRTAASRAAPGPGVKRQGQQVQNAEQRVEAVRQAVGRAVGEAGPVRPIVATAKLEPGTPTARATPTAVEKATARDVRSIEKALRAERGMTPDVEKALGGLVASARAGALNKVAGEKGAGRAESTTTEVPAGKAVSSSARQAPRPQPTTALNPDEPPRSAATGPERLTARRRAAAEPVDRPPASEEAAQAEVDARIESKTTPAEAIAKPPEPLGEVQAEGPPAAAIRFADVKAAREQRRRQAMKHKPPRDLSLEAGGGQAAYEALRDFVGTWHGRTMERDTKGKSIEEEPGFEKRATGGRPGPRAIERMVNDIQDAWTLGPDGLKAADKVLAEEKRKLGNLKPDKAKLGFTDHWVRTIGAAIESFGPAAKKLGEMAQYGVVSKTQRELNTWTAKMRFLDLPEGVHRLDEKMHGKDVDDLSQVMDGFEKTGKATIPKGVSDNVRFRALIAARLRFGIDLPKGEVGEKATAAADFMRDFFVHVKNRAIEAQLPFTPIEKNYMPVMFRDEVFPPSEWLKRAGFKGEFEKRLARANELQDAIAEEVLAKINKMPEEARARIVKAVAEINKVAPTDLQHSDIVGLLHDFHQHKGSPYFRAALDDIVVNRSKNLELHRLLDTTHGVEWDPAVLFSRYARPALMRLNFANTFGVNGERAQQLIRLAGLQGYNEKDLTRLFDVGLEQIPKFAGGKRNRLVDEASGMVAFSKLGTSVFSQFATSARIKEHTNVEAFRGSFKDAIRASIAQDPHLPKSFRERWGDKHAALYVAESGAMVNASLDAAVREMSGFMPKAASVLLHYTGMTAIDRFNRNWAALAGRRYADYTLDKLTLGKQRGDAEIVSDSRNKIRELYQDPAMQKLADKTTHTKAEREMLLQIGGEMIANKTQFRTLAYDLPLMASDPVLGNLFKLQTFALRTTAESFRQFDITNPDATIRNEAVRTRFLAGLAASGVAAYWIQRAKQIAARRDMDQIANDPVWQRIMDVASFAGFFTSVIDAADMARGRFGDVQERLTGPTFGTIADLGQAGISSIAQADAAPLGRFVLRSTPTTMWNGILGVPTGKELAKEYFPPQSEGSGRGGRRTGRR